MSELLDAAIGYARQGLPVFPCHPETKRPLTTKGFKDAVTDEAAIADWWRQWPQAMIGMPTGPRSGVWVRDIDDVALFEPAAQALGIAGPSSRRCVTGKGYHDYYAWDPAQPVRNAQCRVDKDTGAKIWPYPEAPGLEVRGEGGYVILPPSVHPSGRRYEWAEAGEPAKAPEALVRLLQRKDAPPSPSRQKLPAPAAQGGDTAYGLAALADECQAIQRAPDGAQEKTLNDAALKIGGLVAGGALTAGTAKGRLIAAGSAMPSYNSRDAWTADAVARKIERGLADGAATPRAPQQRAIRRDYAPAQQSAEIYDLQTGEVVDQGAAEAVAADQAPIDLWARYEAPKLPIGLLPTVIEQYACRHGDVMGVSPVGLAMSALAVCAGAIPDQIALQVKRYDPNWRESARLWIGMIGPPSTKKSPIMREAMRALARIDGALMRSFMLEKAAYDALPTKEQKTATKPQMKRHVVSDATIEALQEVLKGSTAGVLSEQDELSGWFGQMDKYTPGKGAQADRAFWLKAYNGGRYTLDRVARGSSQIPNLSISLLGGIQPDVIRKAANESTDDGLIQRLVPVILPPASVGKDAPTGDAVREYTELVGRLVLLEPPVRQGIPAFEGDDRPVPLIFSDAARAVRERLEKEHADLVRALEGTSAKLASHFGKYDGLFARLCVVWHCVENCDQGPIPPREISERTALRVAEFMELFIRPSAIAFYVGMLGLSDDHEAVQALASFIVYKRLEFVNAQTVQKSTQSLRAFTADDARKLCEKLESYGWLDPTEPPSRSHTPRWRVNPRVHDLFDERAKRESERRTEARKALRSTLKG